MMLFVSREPHMNTLAVVAIVVLAIVVLAAGYYAMKPLKE